MGTHDNTAAAYLRVSTEGQTLDNQRAGIEQIVNARRLTLAHTYEETASAASSRPVLSAAIDGARRGEFRWLVVWSLDRLGRSMAGNVATVLELDRIGVRTVSVTESWLDTDGPVRPLLLAIFSWIAEQERRRLGERTRAGLERARSRGVPIGRPRTSIPLAVAAQLVSEGHSVRGVARMLAVPPSTLARQLASRKRGAAGGA